METERTKDVPKVPTPLELEATLIEQEHRLLKVLGNVLKRSDWPAGDPRRRAAITALLWRIFSPGTAAAATGGAAAILTAVFLVYQSALLKTQLDLQQQRDSFDQEIRLESLLFDPSSRASTRTRERALDDYIQRMKVDGRVNLRGVNLQGCRLIGKTFRDVDFGGAMLGGADNDSVPYG